MVVDGCRVRQTAPLCLPLPHHEYVLGLADLTGELMRRCISLVSSGQLDECWRLCALLRTIHEGFVNIGQSGRTAPPGRRPRVCFPLLIYSSGGVGPCCCGPDWQRRDEFMTIDDRGALG